MQQHISLVLSSGGARGFAHIGAIEELESSGYVIDSVVGCSMGALVGGLYATGHLGEVKEWFKSLKPAEIASLTDLSIHSTYVVKGEKIIDRIKEFVPDCLIEDLPIPFRCVATDVIHGRQVVFDHGSLFKAMRASISIPMLFRPVQHQGTLLVDGGVLNPLPIDLAPRHYRDKLVVVNVSALNDSDDTTPLLEPRKKNNVMGHLAELTEFDEENSSHFIALMLQSFNLMIQQNTALTLRSYKPDVLVSLPMSRLGDFDYDRASELIELGRQAMHNAL